MIVRGISIFNTTTRTTQVKKGRIKLELVLTQDMSADSPNHCLALVTYTCLRVSVFLMDYTLGPCKYVFRVSCAVVSSTLVSCAV